MGCGSSAPEELLDDPTGPSTFFLKKAGMISSNYKVFKDNEEGGLWLLLRKKGKWGSDDALFTLENYKIEEGKKTGQVLAVAKFDTLDSDAYKFSKLEVHDDSDDSEYSDSDSDEETEVKQKIKWKVKTSCKFYTDPEHKNQAWKLVAKGKGKAKREVEFVTNTDEEGKETTTARVSGERKLKKMFYHLKPVIGGAAAGAGGVEESKGQEGTEGVEVPIILDGKLSKHTKDLEWHSPMFDIKISGTGRSQKPTIKTKEGFEPAMAMLIGHIVSMEMAPEDLIGACHPPWPTVHGPNGCSA